jgi:hypothetical protein
MPPPPTPKRPPKNPAAPPSAVVASRNLAGPSFGSALVNGDGAGRFRGSYLKNGTLRRKKLNSR